MVLKDYVKKNWPIVKMKYGHVVQKDRRNDWAGNAVAYPTLWEKGDHCRLYIPLSVMFGAGYIDLNRQTYHVEVTAGRTKIADTDGEANDLLRKVLAELQSEATSG